MFSSSIYALLLLPKTIVNSRQINSVPRPRWTHLSHRRLQTWPSALTKTNTLIAAPLPAWLASPIICPRFEELGLFRDAPHGGPNHILINEYRPGQGIMPHEDGPAYHPLVATVSLGSATVLDLYAKTDDDGNGGGARRPRHRVLQERRSLLVTRGALYREFLHGIAETSRDETLDAATICNWNLLGERERFAAGWAERQTRISLTYRDVVRVAKLGSVMKFVGKS